MSHTAAIERIVSFYEKLQPSDLDSLETIYTKDAWFKDPFNEVEGTKAIRRIFEHMFATLHEPRFIIRETMLQKDRSFLIWDFVFRRTGDASWITIQGTTHLVLASDGRIARHRDYWDVAEELYEKLPILGTLMRWLKRRAASGVQIDARPVTQKHRL